jgi:hypothetical protein
VTTVKQWAANRENARRSTGPKTEDGKRRSRRNALRHGLTSQTVIEELEDTKDYRAFEASIIADYDPTTAVERELVLRLASLLWRIRRATRIETDLMQIQAEILRDHQNTCATEADSERSPHNIIHRVLNFIPRGLREDSPRGPDADPDKSTDIPTYQSGTSSAISVKLSRELTICFLRLADLDGGAFERVGRYQVALWRQVLQTLLALHPLRRRYRY